MVVTCEACGHNNKINNPEVFRGMKNVVFTCKNKSCKRKVNFYLPSKEELDEKREDITLVIHSLKKVRSAYLEYEAISGEIFTIEVKDGVNHVGRKAKGFHQEISINTDDRHMSRMHAIIIGKNVDGSQMCILRDYNSKNKVKLNGKVISTSEEVYLMEGDRITLGSTVLKYKVNYDKGED